MQATELVHDQTQNQTALSRAVAAARSANALSKSLAVRQSSLWSWQNRPTGAAPQYCAPIVAATAGEVTADELRPDVFGWLGHVNSVVKSLVLSPDAKLAYVGLLWNQVRPTHAVAWAVEAFRWDYARALRAVNALRDAGLEWRVAE